MRTVAQHEAVKLIMSAMKCSRCTASTGRYPERTKPSSEDEFVKHMDFSGNFNYKCPNP